MWGKKDGDYEKREAKEAQKRGKRSPNKKMREKERRDNVTILFHTFASK